MTAKKFGWERSYKGWAIASTIFPFLIFGLLELLDLTVIQKAIVIVAGSLIWLAVLLPIFVQDWDEKRREMIKEVSGSDALLKLFQVSIDVKEDGSSVLNRKITAVNYAQKREYYELESWNDPERDASYESDLRNKRTLSVNVNSVHKGQKIVVSKKKEIPPHDARRVNRIVHDIPVSKETPLEPYDTFEIDWSEKTEPKTWKLQAEPGKGDHYQHRVRHITEKLLFELTLPREWNFPITSEKLAKGEVSDPSCGRFDETTNQPSIEKNVKGRWQITWEIDYPKLLNIYRVTYHPMIRIGSSSSKPTLASIQ